MNSFNIHIPSIITATRWFHYTINEYDICRANHGAIWSSGELHSSYSAWMETRRDVLSCSWISPYVREYVPIQYIIILLIYRNPRHLSIRYLPCKVDSISDMLLFLRNSLLLHFATQYKCLKHQNQTGCLSIFFMDSIFEPKETKNVLCNNNGK